METPDSYEPLTLNKIPTTPAELVSYRSASHDKYSLWLAISSPVPTAGRPQRLITESHWRFTTAKGRLWRNSCIEPLLYLIVLDLFWIVFLLYRNLSAGLGVICFIVVITT